MQKIKLQIKIKNFIFGFWPLLFITCVWFIFSTPYFIHNRIPYPAKYQVSFFTPWSEYKDYAGPVKNKAIPDVVDQIYPWKHFTIEELKRGELPLWNPYSFSGNPNLANYQTSVFSFFNLIFLALPFVDAWSILILLQPLVAGISLYLFLRELKISKTGGTIGSIAFMFCGFVVVWMAYGTLSMAVALLPLGLFAAEKSFYDKKLLVDILIPLSITASFFSGHFQTSLYFVLYLFFYILFKYFLTRDLSSLIRVGLLCLVGIFISLIQILPTVEFYKLSLRSEIFSNSGGIPMQYLVTLFAPDFFGSPITGNSWFGDYAEWASFVGIIPLLFSIFGVSARKENRNVIFFILTGLISLLLSLNTPLQSMISVLKIPIFSTSLPSRMIVIFSFSLTVLAGFGFDYFMKLIEKKNIKKIALNLSPMVIVLLSLWISLIIKVIPPDKTILSIRNLFLPSFVFCLVIGLIMIAQVIRGRKAFLIVGFIILLLSSFDSLRFANKWMPFDSRDYIFPRVRVIEEMQKRVGLGRVYGDFWAYIDTYYHIPSIEGYDPLYSKRYGEFIESSANGQFTQAKKSLVSLPKRGKYTDRVLDLLGVDLIYHPISRTNQGWAYPVWEKLHKYSVVYQDEKFQLFKNQEALPRAKLFYQYEVISDDELLIKRFYSDNFDFRDVLILEQNPGFEKSSKNDYLSKAKAEITSYNPNRIVIDVFSEEPALLFLSDNYYPTWRAKVNGKLANIYRADYSFRAVVVPQGRSIVEYYIDQLF